MRIFAICERLAAQERVADLLSREKEGELSPEEKSELDRYYLQLEHLMRLAKARARDFLPLDSSTVIPYS